MEITHCVSGCLRQKVVSNMLILSRKQGEAIVIDDKIEIIVNEINKDTVKIAVIAPRSVRVLRKELVDNVIDSNKAAVVSVDPMQLRNLIRQTKK